MWNHDMHTEPRTSWSADLQRKISCFSTWVLFFFSWKSKIFWSKVLDLQVLDELIMQTDFNAVFVMWIVLNRKDTEYNSNSYEAHRVL